MRIDEHGLQKMMSCTDIMGGFWLWLTVSGSLDGRAEDCYDTQLKIVELQFRIEHSIDR